MRIGSWFFSRATVFKHARPATSRVMLMPQRVNIFWAIVTLLLTPLLLLGANGARGDEHGYSMPLLDDSLSRWTVSDCAVRYADGLLTLVDGNGLVRSVHPYADFVWQLEYRPLKDADWDAGLYFRSEPPAAGAAWPDRYQVNLKQGQEGQLLGVDVAVREGLTRPGEWNQMRLAVIGRSATLHINDQPAWTTDQIAVESGFIGIQVEVPLGGQFELRNMQITELDHHSVFNGQDLSGWEGAGEDASACWRVSDAGLLTCTGEKGPWLRSQQQYGDFNFRFEYLLNEGGNSGVYVRVPEDGAHHGANAGVEIQLLDDHAPRYRELKPYQYTGSIYAIVPAEPRVARPAGQWNTMEIDCHGTSYRILHNGVQVVAANSDQAPELAQRLVSGYLGLQNHSEEVLFRNLRLGNSLQAKN